MATCFRVHTGSVPRGGFEASQLYELLTEVMFTNGWNFIKLLVEVENKN